MIKLWSTQMVCSPGERQTEALVKNGKNGKNGKLKKLLGMHQRPTTAGQARFGDVDVTGAQTTAREQERLNERLGEAAGAGLRDLVGAQMTQDEIRRANRQKPIDRYLRGTRR